MKKFVLLVPVLLFFLVSCNKAKINDLNSKINQLQDSVSIAKQQQTAMVDSILNLINSGDTSNVDIKALKMEQIANLFTAISRNPQVSGYFVTLTESLYSDYTELLPLSDKAVKQRGAARGAAFSSLFSAIARNPSQFNKLDSAAMRFLGVYSPDYISDELLEYTKVSSMPGLYDAISRNPAPEIDSLLNIETIKYLNFSIKN